MYRCQKRLFLWLSVLLTVCLLTSCISKVPSSTDDPAQLPEEQVFVDLPAGYEAHLLLQAKGRGPCKTLTGDVLVTVILVDDAEAAWTEEAVDAVKAGHETYTEKLMAEAAGYGVSVNLSFQYLTCRIENGPVIISDYIDWTDAALEACGLPDKNAIDAHLKKTFDVDEAPVLFYVNYTGRSFAAQKTKEGNCEYAVYFNNEQDYRHELYHLFGAEDYYFPSAVTASAKKHFPNSIMLGKKDVVTDDLAAYLIGWTDQPSEKAMTMLAETASITEEEIDAERADATFTGNKTVEKSNGTYTGDLVAGLEHGHGKMVWHSGTVYEGEWENGKIQGHGTIRWASGTTYTGEFVDGKVTGYGTMTYTDGTTRTGYWENGKAID